VKKRMTRTRHARHGSARVWYSIFFFLTSQIENNDAPI
jgi:hypothetical protein